VIIGFAFALLGFAACAIAAAVNAAVRGEETRAAIRSFVAEPEPEPAPLPVARVVRRAR
jgi:hypothetical protein